MSESRKVWSFGSSEKGSEFLSSNPVFNLLVGGKQECVYLVPLDQPRSQLREFRIPDRSQCKRPSQPRTIPIGSSSARR